MTDTITAWILSALGYLCTAPATACTRRRKLHSRRTGTLRSRLGPALVQPLSKVRPISLLLRFGRV